MSAMRVVLFVVPSAVFVPCGSGAAAAVVVEVVEVVVVAAVVVDVDVVVGVVLGLLASFFCCFALVVLRDFVGRFGPSVNTISQSSSSPLARRSARASN